MAVLELFSKAEELKEKSVSEQVYLGSTVLLHNARWFIRVRWMVVAIFVLTGVTGNLASGILINIGVVPPVKWPWFLSAVLILTNIFFSIHFHRLNEDSRRGVEVNIWLQIITDLTVITVMVHMIGSTNTFIAFIYIFHIALACIFFRPFGSLVVTLVASGMYITDVILEITGILPPRSIIANNLIIGRETPFIALINAVTAVFIWLIAWYLVSNLSRAVRKQDKKLSDANKKLLKANREKTMQVLVTTHELKSPFSVIETLIKVLKFKYWDETPESVREIISKIEARSHTLRERISKILLLGNIKIKPVGNGEVSSVDIKDIISSVLKNVEEEAERRKITVNVNIPHKVVCGNKEHLNILFSNLIMNAIVYSHEKGVVNVSAKPQGKELHLYISDHGIGIRDDALPHIFDEYFRTNEGVRFNKRSTGLGLSIVKEIAKNHKYGIRVKSELNRGTTFEIIIPESKNLIGKED